MWQDLYKAAFYYLLKLGVPQADAEEHSSRSSAFHILEFRRHSRGKIKSLCFDCGAKQIH